MLKLPNKIIFAALLLVFGMVEIVEAHSQVGQIPRKKSKAAATNKYSVTCSNNAVDGITDHLMFSVKDMKPLDPSKISIQGEYTDPVLGVVASAISTDVKDNNAIASPELILAGGAGPYTLSITRTRSRIVGRENYVVIFHCVSASGEHTGTEINLIDRQ